MAKRISAAEAAAQMGDMAKAIDLMLQAGLKKGLYRVRGSGIKGIRGKGVGRRLWGANGKGVQAMVKVDKFKRDGSVVHSGIIVQGLPALMETGGSTMPHRRGSIPYGGRLKGKAMAFTIGGRTVFARKVKPHGVRIKRDPSVEPAFDKYVATMAQDIQAATDEMVARVTGG